MANFAKLSEAEYRVMLRTFANYFAQAGHAQLAAEERYMQHRAEQAARAIVNSIRAIEKYNARHQ